MGIIRPATPGFIVTLTATILLAVVSFNTPLIKSVYFLKASLAVEGVGGNITFGTLGFCMQLANGTTCSKPTVGYQLDINKLVGDNTKIQIPQVVVKWITYVLVLHIVALCFAAGSALFGLLAHIREFSMSCLSTCISGFGAVVTLLAFIFDLAFFFTAKSRINAVNGGHAEMGNAIWLTLAAWLLMFFSGCFYCLGRCCVSRRPRDSLPKHSERAGSNWAPPTNGYEDQMRLDAVKAEADRKARVARGEVGLPAFQEYDPTQPLASHREEEDGYVPNHHAGYAQATPGTRAVDDYYNPAGANANNLSYPPQPRRELTTGSGHSQQTSGYQPSVYVDASNVVPLHASPPPASNQYLAAGQQNLRASPSQAYGHEQWPSQASSFTHSQQPSNVAYGQAITHDYPSPPLGGAFPAGYHDPYAQPNAGVYGNATQPYPHSNTDSYYSQPSPPARGASPPTRNYTLGGGGYGDNIVPSLHDAPPSPLPYPGSSNGPSAIQTNVQSRAGPTSPRGPRQFVQSPTEQPQYEDSPPMYDDGTAQPPGAWGSKH